MGTETNKATSELMLRLAREFSRATIYPHGEFLDITIGGKSFVAEYLLRRQWRIVAMPPSGWMPEATPADILDLEGVITFIRKQVLET